MAQFFAIHPTHPQPRLVRRAADIVRGGGLIAYPTDSCYALGCHLGAAGAGAAAQRRGIDERHHLTLMCRDLSEIATYAMVDDAQLPAAQARRPAATPSSCARGARCRGARRARRPSACAFPAIRWRTRCSRSSASRCCRRRCSFRATARRCPTPSEIRARLEQEVDLVIDAGACGTEPSTVIDLSGEAPVVLREGKGPLAPFAVERSDKIRPQKMDVNHLVQTVAIYALPVLFAITLHEAAHGYVARHFGDMTAHAQGRISLNPLRHIDPIGTVVVPLVFLIVLRAASFSSAGQSRCRSTIRRCASPRPHMAWVAAAGPAPTWRWRSCGRWCCAWRSGCRPRRPASELAQHGTAGTSSTWRSRAAASPSSCRRRRPASSST